MSRRNNWWLAMVALVVSATRGLSIHGDRVFSPAEAKGGQDLDPTTTAVVLIEFQNEFTADGGKLHDAVKETMDATEMLTKAAKVAAAARKAGCTIVHAPIAFGADDNPNPGLGILKACKADDLFAEGSWNAAFDEKMKPEAGDVVVQGKKGLDAFPGTDLEKILVDRGIHHVVLAGFLTNCCVESTMRTAYEKGFNTVTLTDCCATTSPEGHSAATSGTFGMFSTPMTADEYLATLGP
mmetsp:Transcript_10667/g.27140  ORF Transcript_10667/g.27140 Transcript_10667/m.27140 type:complete len:239 (-) Transcript_10667:120-836(-)